MLIFSATALIAAAVTMALPESKNIKLPDTIVEAVRMKNEEKPVDNKNLQ